jgi:hypothetical protein
MLWFRFWQNNSGGYRVGPHYVYVEAKNAEYANFIASKEGPVYFRGCATGEDCRCCGDRWSPCWDSDGMTAEDILKFYEDDVLNNKDPDILVINN